MKFTIFSWPSNMKKKMTLCLVPKRLIAHRAQKIWESLKAGWANSDHGQCFPANN